MSLHQQRRAILLIRRSQGHLHSVSEHKVEPERPYGEPGHEPEPCESDEERPEAEEDDLGELADEPGREQQRRERLWHRRVVHAREREVVSAELAVLSLARLKPVETDTKGARGRRRQDRVSSSCSLSRPNDLRRWTYHVMRQSWWTNLIDPAHLHGWNSGWPGSGRADGQVSGRRSARAQVRSVRQRHLGLPTLGADRAPSREDQTYLALSDILCTRLMGE